MTTRKSNSIPDHISVLGVPFRVELAAALDEATDDEVEPTWGDTVGFNRRIRINSHQDTRRQWTTLLHEYMHATLYVIGAQLDDDVEEMIVQSLEHSIEQFMLNHGEPFVRALEVQK